MKKSTNKLMLIALLGLGISDVQSATAQLSPIVRTDSGQVKGLSDDKMLSWLGIPYAAAPQGEHRWKPPVSHANWNDIRDATAFGNVCPQNADLGVFGKAGGAEDCLNLNIYASKAALQTKQKLPVFVWIHGGSLWVGAGRDYDASKLALKGNTIVVTINYRLGILGYLAHPEIDKEGHKFGNYGLMDQQLALDWIQRNIAAFGGDPDNVTISGESSGGNSVLSHIVSPDSAGKFQHAASMSGGAVVLRWPTFGAPVPLEVAEKYGNDFSRAVGCTGDNRADCLRQLPLKTVLEEQRPYLVNQLILDGKSIPQHPGDAFQQGNVNHATLINGITRDEGTFFAGFPENETGVVMQGKSYEDTMHAFFGKNTAAVMTEYALGEYATPSNAFAAAVTDMLFACPAHAINQRIAKVIPTYAYEFADRTAPSYLKPTSFALGAAHTYELPYLFPGFHGGAGIPVRLNSMQERLSDKMVEYWANASKAQQREKEWPRFDPTKDNVMSLVLPVPVMQEGIYSKVHHCNFWDAAQVY